VTPVLCGKEKGKENIAPNSEDFRCSNKLKEKGGVERKQGGKEKIYQLERDRLQKRKE